MTNVVNTILEQYEVSKVWACGCTGGVVLTLNPTPHTLQPTPYTLHPTLQTLHPSPWTPHPQPSTLNPKL